VEKMGRRSCGLSIALEGDTYEPLEGYVVTGLALTAAGQGKGQLVM